MIGLGGIRSVASSQDQAASQNLEAYNRPLSVTLVDKSRDWAARQQIAYAGILGLLQKDFLSLADWTEQIQTYSQANSVQLAGPLAAILAKTKLNLLLQSRVSYDAALQATVGTSLETIDGFSTVYTAPEEIVSDSQTLADTLGVG